MTDYEEQPIATIELRGLLGSFRVPTYSLDGMLEAIDGYERRRRRVRRPAGTR